MRDRAKKNAMQPVDGYLEKRFYGVLVRWL